MALSRPTAAPLWSPRHGIASPAIEGALRGAGIGQAPEGTAPTALPELLGDRAAAGWPPVQQTIDTAGDRVVGPLAHSRIGTSNEIAWPG
ncbi:hypothetical protein A5647_13810 [Mycobacterium sp. 1100029.7]|nr:hypothetical protein A5647_13810 [Mycobacterium sp. 1100029.7]